MTEKAGIDRTDVPVQGSQIARNTAYNLLGNVAPLAVGILCTPTVIRGLSPDDFGVLTLCWALLGYAAIFDLGVTRALTRNVANKLARSETTAINSIAWTAFYIQLALGLVTMCVLAAVTPFITSRVLNIDPDALAGTRLSFYFLACSFPAVLAYNSLRGLLEAAQRFGYVNIVRGPFNALNFFWPYLAVVLGYELPTIVLGLTVARLLAVIAQGLLCHAAFRGMIGRPCFDRSWARRLVAYGSWVTVSNVISPILVYADRFVIGAVLTMAAVGYYGLPLEIISRLLAIPASLVTALFPVFSGLNRQQHGHVYRSLLSTSARYLLIMLGPIVIVLMVHAHTVLTVWIDPAFAEQGALPLSILAIGFLANALALVPLSLLQGSGRPDIPAKLHTIELPLHLLCIFIAVRLWGLPGAAAAWTLRVVLDAVLLYVMAGRLVQAPAPAPAVRLITSVIGVLTVMLAAAALGTQLLMPNSALIMTVGLAFAAWIYCWFSVLRGDERALIRGIFRKVP